MEKVRPAPLPRSYWVDDHLIAGAYPGALNEAEAEGKISWGGIGRTGTIIGCYLARGIGGEAALDALTELRSASPDARRSSPETADQVDFVRRWPRS